MSELFIIHAASGRVFTKKELASLGPLQNGVATVEDGDAWATFNLQRGALAAKGDLTMIRADADRFVPMVGPHVIYPASGDDPIEIG